MIAGEEATSSSLERAANIERMLRGVRQHVIEDSERIDDARARLLFATTVQILDALVASFSEFQQAAGLVRNGLPH